MLKGDMFSRCNDILYKLKTYKEEDYERGWPRAQIVGLAADVKVRLLLEKRSL
jgi:hypothetical protein